jgi:hypothetical protein
VKSNRSSRPCGPAAEGAGNTGDKKSARQPEVVVYPQAIEPRRPQECAALRRPVIARERGQPA